ncbi:MAG: type II secretion system major pseudopilin GspG, partial [Candidatus Limnocylindria bacterium]
RRSHTCKILQGLKALQDDTGQRGRERPSAGPAPLRLRAPASGFTLIELLVVIAVIAILAGLVAPQVFSNVGDARTTSGRAQIENFGLALDAYRLDNHQYPSTEQGLAALMTAPTGDPPAANWRGPYLRRALPNDPWGHPYLYRCPGDSVPTGYDLLSYGRDAKAGGAGEDQDITSWGPSER